MEFAEERAFRERIGTVTFDSPEWKRIPTQRFQFISTDMMNKLDDLTPAQRVWLETKMYHIPFYEHYNPIAMVLGFMCLSFDLKKITPHSFSIGENLWKKYSSIMKAYSISLLDLLRYARRWELWCQHLDT